MLAEPSSPGRAWVGAGVFAEPFLGAMIGKDANRRRHKETNAAVTILFVYGCLITMMTFEKDAFTKVRLEKTKVCCPVTDRGHGATTAYDK